MFCCRCTLFRCFAVKELGLTQWFRIQNLSLAHFSDLQVTCFHAVTSFSVKMEIMIERRKETVSSYTVIFQNKVDFLLCVCTILAQQDPDYYSST